MKLLLRISVLLVGILCPLAAHEGAVVAGVTPPVAHITAGVFVGIFLFLALETAIIYGTFKTWFRNPNYPVPPSPERYFHAAIYSFVAMVVTGGILTKFFSGIDFAKTALIPVYGYNNVCVVFDSPPATYICPVYWFFVAYLVVRYAAEDTKRLVKLTTIGPRAKSVAYGVNVTLVVVAAFFSMVLSVRPENDVVGHTMPFLALVAVLPVVFLMHCLQCKERAPWHLGIVILYLVLSYTKIIFDVYALGSGKHVSPLLAQAVDIVWLCCALSTPFVIPAPKVEQVGAT